MRVKEIKLKVNKTQEVELNHCVEVPSFNTTMTCSDCQSLTGPTGWDGLAVRFWECEACGVYHECRDIAAARNILRIGAGYALESAREGAFRNGAGGARVSIKHFFKESY